MIYKSYIVENNLNILKEKMVLFYGENTGLISDIKKKIKTIYTNCEILNYDQDDVLKNNEAIELQSDGVDWYILNCVKCDFK